MAWTFSLVSSVSILGKLAVGWPKIEGSFKLPSVIYQMSESLKALKVPNLNTLTLGLLTFLLLNRRKFWRLS